MIEWRSHPPTFHHPKILLPGCDDHQLRCYLEASNQWLPAFEVTSNRGDNYYHHRKLHGQITMIINLDLLVAFGEDLLLRVLSTKSINLFEHFFLKTKKKISKLLLFLPYFLGSLSLFVLSNV